MTQKVVAMANTYTFYGRHFSESVDGNSGIQLTFLAGDQDFLDAALQYPRDVFIAAEVLRCVPSAFSGSACWLATRGYRASNLMFAKLQPMVEERLRKPKHISGHDEVRNSRHILTHMLNAV
jgi:hypothetical protein